MTSLPWEGADDFGDWHVDIELEARVDPPLLRAESDADPVLQGVSALTGLMGTNLALGVEANERLMELTQDRQLPLGGSEHSARVLERTINLDVQRLSDLVEQDLLAHLRTLGHIEFEEVCALFLRAMGCDDVRVVGAATSGSLGDGGIDVTARLHQAGLPEVPLAVQAKNVGGGVGPSVVTQLRGSLPAGAYGMIITTGHFTRSAAHEAARTDRTQIRLVDGLELAKLLVEKGIGVRKKLVSLNSLDPGGLRDALDLQRG